MILYSLNDATAVDHPQHGRFAAGPDGAFDLPEEVAEELHRIHDRGRKLWETTLERATRLAREEAERRQDPAAQLSVLERLEEALRGVTAAQPKRRTRKAKADAAEAPDAGDEAPEDDDAEDSAGDEDAE